MKVFLLASIFVCSIGLSAQDYYWVGGTGNWSDLSHWATSSGGSEFHTELPSEVNDVYFDENSFSGTGQVVTLDLDNCYCRDFNTEGVQHFPLITSPQYNVTLRPYGDIYFDPNMQRNLGQLVMSKESGIQELVTSNISLGQNCNLSMYGGADYHFMDSVSVRSFGNSDGRLYTNGNPVNCSVSLQSNYGPYREMHLSTSNIYCSSVQINSGMLMDADEAHFYINGANGFNNNFWGSGFTYGVVEFTGEISVTGDNTFGDFIVHPGSEITLESGSVQIADQFEFNGSSIQPISLTSSVAGEQASISQASGTVDGNYMVIRDNNASGGAVFTADNSIDQGNNTGWNIIENLPSNYYWVNGGGSWSDLNHWATSSGGTEYFSSLPTAQDTVIFDEMSFSNAGTLEIDVVANCADWRMANVNTDMVIDAEEELNLYGSITLSAGIEANFKEILFKGANGPYQITSNGTYWGPESTLVFEVGGEFELGDDFFGQAIQVNDGIFRSMGHTIDLDWELKTQAIGSPFLDLINSTVNCNYWRPYDPNQFGYALQNSVINCGANFYGNGLSYPEVRLFGIQNNVTAGASFNSLTVDPGSTLIFESGSSFTLDNVTLNGTSNQVITIRSSSPGEEAYFIGNGSDVVGEYLNITDNHASGSASFTAVNSTLNTNVQGWLEPLSVNELNFITAVYPNPCKDILNIEMPQATTLELYSALGELVRVINPNGAVRVTVDLGDLAPGVYVLRQQSLGAKGITLVVE